MRLNICSCMKKAVCCLTFLTALCAMNLEAHGGGSFRDGGGRGGLGGFRGRDGGRRNWNNNNWHNNHNHYHGGKHWDDHNHNYYNNPSLLLKFTQFT